jgi:hypothetical protein
MYCKFVESMLSLCSCTFFHSVIYTFCHPVTLLAMHLVDLFLLLCSIPWSASPCVTSPFLSDECMPRLPPDRTVVSLFPWDLPGLCPLRNSPRRRHTGYGLLSLGFTKCCQIAHWVAAPICTPLAVHKTYTCTSVLGGCKLVPRLTWHFWILVMWIISRTC